MFAFFKSFLNFKVSKKCLEETISYSLQLTVASTTNGSQLHDRNLLDANKDLKVLTFVLTRI